jgi:hypothetical protein
MASWDTSDVVAVGLPCVLISPDISSFQMKNFSLDRYFKFVEMSGFFTVCCSVKILHI